MRIIGPIFSGLFPILIVAYIQLSTIQGSNLTSITFLSVSATIIFHAIFVKLFYPKKVKTYPDTISPSMEKCIGSLFSAIIALVDCLLIGACLLVVHRVSFLTVYRYFIYLQLLYTIPTYTYFQFWSMLVLLILINQCCSWITVEKTVSVYHITMRFTEPWIYNFPKRMISLEYKMPTFVILVCSFFRMKLKILMWKKYYKRWETWCISQLPSAMSFQEFIDLFTRRIPDFNPFVYGMTMMAMSVTAIIVGYDSISLVIHPSLFIYFSACFVLVLILYNNSFTTKKKYEMQIKILKKRVRDFRDEEFSYKNNATYLLNSNFYHCFFYILCAAMVCIWGTVEKNDLSNIYNTRSGEVEINFLKRLLAMKQTDVILQEFIIFSIVIFSLLLLFYSGENGLGVKLKKPQTDAS